MTTGQTSRSPAICHRRWSSSLVLSVCLLVTYFGLSAAQSQQIMPPVCAGAIDNQTKALCMGALARCTFSLENALHSGTPEYPGIIAKCVADRVRNALTQSLAPVQPPSSERRSNRRSELMNACRNGEEAAGIKACTALIQSSGNSPHEISVAYAYRGIHYFGANKLDSAAADFDRSIQADPSVAEAFLGRAGILLSRGEYDHTIADVGQAIELRLPRNLLDHAYRIRGRAYCLSAMLHSVRKEAAEATSTYQLAMEDFDRAIRISSERARVLYLRGECENGFGKRADGQRDIGVAKQMNPNIDK